MGIADFPILLSSPPTRKELAACWDLTRLNSGLGFGVEFFYPLVLSMIMAYRANPELSMITVMQRLAVFWVLCCGITAFIMTVDDILDADLDAKVARTKDRAIPRGDITVPRAWMFLSLQAALGLFLANKFLKTYTLYIAAATWPVIIIYPTCKRWMSFAAIVVGLIANAGVFMGWSDLSSDGRIPWDILTPVYFGCCFWTITWETVYQHLDREEDMRLGIKSFAVFCGDYTNIVCGSTSMLFAGLLAYGAYLNSHGLCVYMAIAAGVLTLLLGIAKTNINVRSQCKDFYLLTPRIGAILAVGFGADAFIHRWTNGIPF